MRVLRSIRDVDEPIEVVDITVGSGHKEGSVGDLRVNASRILPDFVEHEACGLLGRLIVGQVASSADQQTAQPPGAIVLAGGRFPPHLVRLAGDQIAAELLQVRADV